jgi:hypothetical protein
MRSIPYAGAQRERRSQTAFNAEIAEHAEGLLKGLLSAFSAIPALRICSMRSIPYAGAPRERRSQTAFNAEIAEHAEVC